jgi:hypothetical protein
MAPPRSGRPARGTVSWTARGTPLPSILWRDIHVIQCLITCRTLHTLGAMTS